MPSITLKEVDAQECSAARIPIDHIEKKWRLPTERTDSLRFRYTRAVTGNLVCLDTYGNQDGRPTLVVRTDPARRKELWAANP